MNTSHRGPVANTVRGRVRIVTGGDTRRKAWLSLNALECDDDDMSSFMTRCGADRSTITRTIEAVKAQRRHRWPPALDTIKQVERTADGIITATIPRDTLCGPQPHRASQ